MFKELNLTDASDRLFNRCVDLVVEQYPVLNKALDVDSIRLMFREDFLFVALVTPDHKIKPFWGHSAKHDEFLDYVFGPEQSHDKVMFKLTHF